MERRLAAILAADIVGYSRMTGRDEAGTVARVSRFASEILTPMIARHRGRLFKRMGDGFLVEFASAVGAVACALDWQARMAREDGGDALTFRIGIHLGDVIVEGDDLLGESVNIATRLEQAAPVGGIAVSAELHGHVDGKTEARFEHLGERHFRNIERPVRVWVVPPADAAGASEVGSVARLDGLATTPERGEEASVAVLPFSTLSPDRSDDYLAMGVADQLVTMLGHVPWFFVSAESASFSPELRGRSHAEIGRRLGVRYLVEGALQQASGRLRISVRLAAAATGQQLWSQSFAGALDDIFDLQDRIARKVIGEIEPRLRQIEIRRSQAKHGSLTAYDCYLQALPLIRGMSGAEHDAAMGRLQEAIRHNPHHAAAHGLIAWLMTLRLPQGRGLDLDLGVFHANEAVARGTFDSEALSTGGYSLGFLTRDLDLGLGHLRDALALNPSAARTHDFLGWLLLYAGRPADALDHFLQSMELSPIDDFAFRALTGQAFALLFLDRPAEAVATGRRARSANPRFTVCHRVLAPALVAVGDIEGARAVVDDLRSRHPDLTVARFTAETRFADPRCREVLFDGLCRAGLPME
ncbi:hypothetical protein M1105_20075 [Limibaculum sp. FT325]|uniref:adenylate/guanylate cyclase domain-containing protein n=1 Tax=Thermohalobaculum sediminis TaxID=2939436 RepID=UPI0020BF8448|nr:adenylate/guanylate cyclase domain-containing protein [Limibaculum sediminis]MCL5779259.1 hypothetical protein [Limibaculum sediminis]